MQFPEAMAISLFDAIIFSAVSMVGIKYAKKTKVFPPRVVYKLNESGAIIESPVDSVPSGVLEAAMERLNSENKLAKSTSFRRTYAVLFAAAAFIVNLIVLLSLF